MIHSFHTLVCFVSKQRNCIFFFVRLSTLGCSQLKVANNMRYSTSLNFMNIKNWSRNYFSETYILTVNLNFNWLKIRKLIYSIITRMSQILCAALFQMSYEMMNKYFEFTIGHLFVNHMIISSNGTPSLL